MARKPETRFRQQQVLPFLKTLPHTVSFPIQQQAICGTPDLLLCVAGRFVGLELKATGGKASPLQIYNLDRVTACGGVAIVASPENWPEVKLLLTTLAQRREHDQDREK